VCVVEAPTLSPRLAVINVSTGRWSEILNPNPEAASFELNPIQQLHWKNKFGTVVNGFLILPRAMKGKPAPLVVMAYGFYGDFVTNATSLSSYPAQMLADRGMAVLLLNPEPYSRNTEVPTFPRTMSRLGDGPLASLKAIVSELSHSGLVDSGHVGYAGHSFGGFMAQYGLEHSDLIAAAEICNGGTFVDPSFY